LNFVAQPDPLPGFTPGLNVSRVVLILETSSSTNRFKTNRLAVTAHRPAKADGSVAVGSFCAFACAPRTRHEMQGSNIFVGLLKQMIKEDHFLRAPRECLRSRRTYPLRGKHLDRPDHAVHQRFWTHILAAIRLIHLSKSISIFYDSPLVGVRHRSARLSSQTTVATFVTVVVTTGFSQWGAESYRPFRPCQPLSNGFDEIFKGVANATCGTSQNDRGSGTAADWSRG